MSFNSGSSGGSLHAGSDVALNNPTDGDVLQYAAGTAKWTNAATSQVLIRYNSTSNTWPARPVAADFGVLFLSTNSVSAAAPTDVNLQAGDRWLRHPDAT